MGRRLRLELVDGCHEDWESMPSATGGRSCAKCERDVVDVTRKTAKQAEALLAAEQAKRGSVCARFTFDPDTGEAKFADPLPRAPRAFLRGVMLAATLAAGCESVVEAAEPAGKPAAVVIPLAPSPVPPSSQPVAPLPPPPPLHPTIAAAPDAGTDADTPVHPTQRPYPLMGRIAIRRD